MRTILFLLLVAVTCASAAVAQSNIPSDVGKAFAAKFPSATDVKWGEENDDEFEAEFMMDDEEMSAVFSTTGGWLETETEMSADKLPHAVSRQLEAEFERFSVTEAALVEKPGADRCYEVEISDGERTYEILLSKDGKLLEKKAADDDDDDDEDEDNDEDEDDDEDEDNEDDD